VAGCLRGDLETDGNRQRTALINSVGTFKAQDEIDLAENAADMPDTISKLAQAILKYAEDYYKESTYWSKGNRKSHTPYVFKALILDDVEKLEA
jgi:hypothetical protein